MYVANLANQMELDQDPDPQWNIGTYLRKKNFPTGNVVDADPDRHQNNADPHADPTPTFTQFGEFFLLLFTVMPVYNVLLVSSVANVSRF